MKQISALLALLCLAACPCPGHGANPKLFDHRRMKPVELEGMRVWLGEPVPITAQLPWQIVWQQTAYRPSWAFIHLTPVMGIFPKGNLIATYTLNPDSQTGPTTMSAFQISRDGGKRWGRRYSAIMQHNPMIFVPEPDDSLLALPSELVQDPVGDEHNFSGPAYLFEHGGDRMLVKFDAVRLVDFPFALSLHAGVQPRDTWHVGLAITGSWTRIGGRLLVPAEIRKKASERLESEIVLASEDGGYTWRHWSTIADFDPARAGEFGYEGPNEGFILTLADGTLMAVYRVGAGEAFPQGVPLERRYSSDGGRTWSKADVLPAFSVKPELVRTKSGVIALTTGRPGIYMWLSGDPRAQAWQKIDIRAHHNEWARAAWPSDPSYVIGELTATSPPYQPRMAGHKMIQTTAYTGLAEVAPNKLIVVYDRDTEKPPANATDYSRVFAMPVEIDRP